MAASAKVKGLPELLAKLRDLGGTDTIEKISFRATFGASKDLREAARANAPQVTGELRRAFAIKRITYGTKRGYTVGVRAGHTRDKRTPDDPFYWWLLEFGTRFIAPMGFFRRAFEAMRSRAPSQIIEAGRKAVIDSGNRALKKHGNGSR